jgi:hypothetical protein
VGWLRLRQWLLAVGPDPMGSATDLGLRQLLLGQDFSQKLLMPAERDQRASAEFSASPHAK